MSSKTNDLSIVIPVFNEEPGIVAFHKSLEAVVSKLNKYSFEIIYVDDGSTDGTNQLIRKLCDQDKAVKLVKLSRNFGKESALTAGIAQAKGSATLMLDGDGQHPVEIIPKFIEAWENGAQVVIGIRASNSKEGWTKKMGSWFFYKLFNKMTGQKLIAGSTDYRLIDKPVQKAYLSLNETDRIARGLIDWLGFRREYIYFKANPRSHGTSSYSSTKLFGLAVNSFTSLSVKPLYIFGYTGIFITIASFLLGVAVIIEQLILNDPLHWKFTGTAMLGILILFLVGLLLMSQGILSIYISNLHSQAKQRPLYVIDHEGSVGVGES